MKIAVTFEKETGNIFQHFGHCEQFKIYEVDKNRVISSEIVSAAGSGHGALAGFLQQNGVEALICGGIGAGARTALADAGIRLYPGAAGSADLCLNALLDGTLEFDPDKTCSHHHGEEHGCGGHSCNEDKHGCS